VGSNLAETMPPVMQYFDEQKRNGGNLIVVDPRATPTAQEATLHLQIAPGTDMALALGLLHIATRDRLLDHAFIAARTTGYRDVRRVVAGYWPERVEAITGVPIDKMTRAAHLLGKAATALILTARGPEQQSKGVDTVLAFINLALALGKAGKPACGYGCLTGQGNGQGGREHGQKADQLPGYRSIENAEDRAHIASVWGIAPDELPGKGRSAYELLDTMGQDGGLRALLVMGSNVAVSSPNAGHVQNGLDALDFLVVADLFLSETAARADVVLPATQWAEEEGTMTNLEGRVLVRRRAQQPPHGVRSDLQIIHGIAERWGHGAKFLTEAEVYSMNCAAPQPVPSPIIRASLTSASNARTACSGPAPMKRIPARRAFFSTASPRPMASRVFTPWSIAARSKNRTPSIRFISRRAASWGTISRARKRGASANCSMPRRVPLSKFIPRWPLTSALKKAMWCASRRGAAKRSLKRVWFQASGRTRFCALPLGRRRLRQPAHQPGARPHFAYARI
jgi:predicted molibdopterin-dependent oxidoreductase YjgC